YLLRICFSSVTNQYNAADTPAANRNNNVINVLLVNKSVASDNGSHAVNVSNSPVSRFSNVLDNIQCKPYLPIPISNIAASARVDDDTSPLKITGSSAGTAAANPIHIPMHTSAILLANSRLSIRAKVTLRAADATPPHTQYHARCNTYRSQAF